MTVAEGTPRPVQRRGRQFRLLERIGAGAYGEVFLAEQDSGAGFVRRVALKLLHPQHASGIDQGRRMRDEARILGHLQHRSIVAVLDLVPLGNAAGQTRWAIVMDYVPGADLEHIIAAANARNVRMPLRAALELGTELFHALDAAWHASDGAGGQLRVVHRDIKPSNIRLTPDGDLKVLDFGVARVNMVGRESETRGTGWIGTERYMSPERILCEGDGPAGDVYGATATLLEVFLGRPLGRTPVLPDRHGPFVEAALVEARARLPEAPDDLREEVIRALRDGLTGEPEDRPDAAAMRDRLDALARQAPGESLPRFSRSFVPEVAAVLGAKGEPVSGVLTEGDGSSGSTLAPESFGEPAVKRSTTPAVARVAAPRPRRQLPLLMRAVILAALLLISMAAGAVGVIAFGVASTGVLAIPLLRDARIELHPAPPEAPAVVAPAPTPRPPAVARPAPEPPAAAPAPPPVPTVAPAPSPAAPRIGKAKVAAPDAAGITVRCGGVTATGTTSALIRDFPAGPCTVEVQIGASTYTAKVPIATETTVRCALAGGSLQCS